MAAKVDAEVTHIYFTEGDNVKQGQVLAELDNEAFIIDGNIKDLRYSEENIKVNRARPNI